MTDLTFFDVETPNRFNDSICSIGVIRSSRQGQIEYQKSFLVNPSCNFDHRNVSIHGIRPSDVLDAPDFFSIWANELADVFSGTVLAAHNALFDIRVLEKSLKRHGEILPEETPFMDTIALSEQLFSDISDYKLPTVCKYLGIPLEKHHDAMADTLGCFGIYVEAVNRFGSIELPIRQIGAPKSKAACKRKARPVSENTKAMKSLLDQVLMMESDGRIAYEEAELLKSWVDDNVENIPTAISEQLADILDDVLLDGAITPEEELRLHDTFSRFLYPAEGNSCSNIDGKLFCLTGEFDYGSRREVTEAIRERGGDCVKSNPTRSCDYVVIGNEGSELYSLGNYGGKVKKALEMQSKGCAIKIISENELIKMF